MASSSPSRGAGSHFLDACWRFLHAQDITGLRFDVALRTRSSKRVGGLELHIDKNRLSAQAGIKFYKPRHTVYSNLRGVDVV